MKPLYIFDIDGTLADLTHRLYWIQDGRRNWDMFNSEVKFDKPIKTIITICQQLMEFNDVYFFTGRMDKDNCREDTLKWLQSNVYGCIPQHELVMRPTNDTRPDFEIKKEMLDNMLEEDRQRLECVFDDRNQVVNMWRSNGIKCLQVAPGDF